MTTHYSLLTTYYLLLTTYDSLFLIQEMHLRFVEVRSSSPDQKEELVIGVVEEGVAEDQLEGGTLEEESARKAYAATLQARWRGDPADAKFERLETRLEALLASQASSHRLVVEMQEAQERDRRVMLELQRHITQLSTRDSERESRERQERDLLCVDLLPKHRESSQSESLAGIAACSV